MVNAVIVFKHMPVEEPEIASGESIRPVEAKLQAVETKADRGLNLCSISNKGISPKESQGHPLSASLQSENKAPNLKRFGSWFSSEPVKRKSSATCENWIPFTSATSASTSSEYLLCKFRNGPPSVVKVGSAPSKVTSSATCLLPISQKCNICTIQRVVPFTMYIRSRQVRKITIP